MPPRSRSEKTSKGDASLWSARKVGLIGSASGIAFIALSFYVYNAYVRQFITIPHLHSLTDRIVFTLRYQIFGLVSLLLTILNVSFTRLFTNAINPLSGNESIVEKGNKILVNTLEQLVFNSANQLIIATYLSEDNMRAIPLLSALFLIGRIAFWIGYQIAPTYRSFGFTVTFVPSVALLLFNLYFLITTNSNYLLDGGKTFGGRMSN